LFTLTACASNDPAPVQPATTPLEATPTPAPTINPPESISTPDSQISEFTETDIAEFNSFWREMIPEAEGYFELNSELREIYDEYILTGSLAVLEGVPPESVFQIWLQSAIDGHFEHEFFLLHPDTIGDLTLEEYLPPLDAPLEFIGTVETRQSWANLYFSRIADDEIIFEDNRALLSFYTETGEHMTYWFRLNEDGIWLVELL